jgi:hypothetical protein
LCIAIGTVDSATVGAIGTITWASNHTIITLNISTVAITGAVAVGAALVATVAVVAVAFVVVLEICFAIKCAHGWLSLWWF